MTLSQVHRLLFLGPLLVGNDHCILGRPHKTCQFRDTLTQSSSHHNLALVKVTLFSKLCFSSCSYTWMFELHGGEWCMYRVWHERAVFTFICWKLKVSLSWLKKQILRLYKNDLWHHSLDPCPIFNLQNCDVETWTSSAQTLYSEVRDILCPAVKLLKWNIFAYSYILVLLREKEKMSFQGF